MLKKYRLFLKTLLFISDILILAGTWFLSIYIRFYVFPDKPDLSELDWLRYSYYLGVVCALWGSVFYTLDLYRPKRYFGYSREFFELLKAATIVIFLVVFITFFIKNYNMSRLVFLIFWGLSTFGLFFTRVLFRSFLKGLRKRGYNLRHVLIVGCGENAKEVIKRFQENPEFGLNICGLLSSDSLEVHQKISNYPVLGTYSDLQKVIKDFNIDQIYIALSFEDMKYFKDILYSIETQTVDVKVIPDLFQVYTLRRSIEDLDGLPIINIRTTPMFGMNIFVKRAFDIFVSFCTLVFLSPLFLIVALFVKISSRGPIFYKQKRMSFNGHEFEMYKFRTMVVGSESETGPVWARAQDDRCTKIGKILRKTSLDELPQFFNVLMGEMSIVGPRPERPEFVEKFQKTVPQYILRLKIKAGITGWAQINGWRGNTSLDKRVECDLYYIENWSLLFDIKILFLTFIKGFIHKNAY